MITVLADDFTGAAEIGGIAIRHGYRVVIDTQVGDAYPDTDIVVIATDTRSMPVTEAQECVRTITSELLKLQPGLIYKKIDSVLRGNILEELTAQMEALDRRRALVVPANPSLQRTIRNGVYYYHGVPLAESDFGVTTDSSHVVDLLGNKIGSEIEVVSKGSSLPETGILVANTEQESDLEYWATCLDNETVVAGASGFFSALLKKLAIPKTIRLAEKEIELDNRAVYVCGSEFPKSRKVVENAFLSGCNVAYMPANLFVKNREKLLVDWKDQIVRGVLGSGSVIVAINTIENTSGRDLSKEICEAFAEVIRLVLKDISLNELLIEGGATASAILQKLDHSRLIPVQELATGVIRMKVAGQDNLHVTMKPGSYSWPESVWPHPVKE